MQALGAATPCSPSLLSETVLQAELPRPRKPRLHSAPLCLTQELPASWGSQEQYLLSVNFLLGTRSCYVAYAALCCQLTSQLSECWGDRCTTVPGLGVVALRVSP